MDREEFFINQHVKHLPRVKGRHHQHCKRLIEGDKTEPVASLITALRMWSEHR
jgi:hypothetical protein